MKEIPQNVSESTRRLNPELYGPLNTSTLSQNRLRKGFCVTVDTETPLKPAKPSPEESLNQTEKRYLRMLRYRFPYQPIMVQAITLRLADNTKYTPDFAYCLPTGALVFVETKGGFIREDAAVKLKTAAAIFPQFTFIKAQYKDGKWTEKIMPK